MVTKIGIVGGGPGGLMATYFLEKMANAPLEITLFEAADRLGGKILTPRFQAVPVAYEAGAAEFYDYSRFDVDPLKELIAELGLSTSPMGGSAVIMDNHILSNLEDINEHLGNSAGRELSAFDRRARDIMGPDDFYYSDHPEGSSHADLCPSNRTLASLIAGVNDSGARRYLTTLIHSDLATEPCRTNVAYGLQNYVMNDPDYMTLYGIVGGNDQLPNELAARISAKIRTEHRVNNIQFENLNRRIRIHSQRNVDAFQDEFDFVIVALPLAHLPSITFEDTKFQDAVDQHCEHYDHPAHYLRVTILFEKPFWRSTLTDSFWMLDQFGGCCLYDESSRQPGGHYGVLGWLLGGDEALQMCEWSDERLIDAALDSLPTFLREGRQYFVEAAVARWPAAVNAMPGGRRQLSQDRRHQPDANEHPNLFLVGDYMFDSTLNGVLDSAHYVASWITAELACQTNVAACN
jgi:protoporphyrinogen oxidase